MDELTLRKQQEDGSKAEAILRSDIAQKAFTDLRTAILERMEACSIRDKDDLMELKRLLSTLANFRGYFEQAVRDGKFASESLKMDKTIGERIANRLRIA